jgi:hypothetical protein
VIDDKTQGNAESRTGQKLDVHVADCIDSKSIYFFAGPNQKLTANPTDELNLPGGNLKVNYNYTPALPLAAPAGEPRSTLFSAVESINSEYSMIHLLSVPGYLVNVVITTFNTLYSPTTAYSFMGGGGLVPSWKVGDSSSGTSFSPFGNDRDIELKPWEPWNPDCPSNPFNESGVSMRYMFEQAYMLTKNWNANLEPYTCPPPPQDYSLGTWGNPECSPSKNDATLMTLIARNP